MASKPVEYGPVAAGHTGKTCTFITGIRRPGIPHGACPELATFALTPFGMEQPVDLVCGRHLTPTTRELSEKHNKAIVSQEIPVRQRRKYR